MIALYDGSSRSLRPCEALPASGWVHVVAPTKEERATLQRDLALPDPFLHHALDPDELARLDRDEAGVRLVVLRVPWHPGEHADLPYRSSTLAIVLHGPLVVTIAAGPDEVARALLDRDPPVANPHRFVLLLLLSAAARFLAYLRDIDREVAALEDQLQSSLANREVLGLLRYQKGLVHFTTALASNRILLERLEKDPRFQLEDADRDLLEDVHVEFRQAAEAAAVSSDILSQMMDAFASIISNNLNVVMKFLAALTLIVAVPTLVASFWGMNVPLPGTHSPIAFAVLAGAAAMVSIGLAWVFARRGWI